MTVERELAPGEWSVLALLAEEPGHGWALARQIIWAWVLTIPASAAIAALSYKILGALGAQ